MQYIPLGLSELKVSNICLGSMTWGTQNNQKQANEQIEFALSQGINFIDTAEMYAVPPSAETYGKTENIIGNWLSKNKNRRAEFTLATKIAGNGLAWIRNGGDITGEAIIESVDASLKRLQTDYIDLYQLHWPNRTSPHFSKHWPGKISFSDVNTEKHSLQMLEILQALDSCIKSGKIRSTVFIIAYLPWSPLAGGVLSGKYLNGARPQGSRWSKSQRNGLFRDNATVSAAVKEYTQVAIKHKLTPAQLALAWCSQFDGVTSTIIGSTSIEQLKEDTSAFEKTLSDEVLSDIDSVIHQYPAPF